MSRDKVVNEARQRELEAAERDRVVYPCDACGSRHAVEWFDDRLLCLICRSRAASELSAEAYKRWR